MTPNYEKDKHFETDDGSGLYLHLYHGRTPADLQLDDWGSEGPFLGPFDFFHDTYGGSTQRLVRLDGYYELWLSDCADEDLIHWGDVWYGDWTLSYYTSRPTHA